MSAESSQGGQTEYIEHHLTHNSTMLGGGSFHWDSWFIALGLGLIFVAWFGVRGVGSIYYAAVAASAAQLAGGDAQLIAWIAIACVVTSIVLHGVTASPLGQRLLPDIEDAPGSASSKAA